MNKEPLEGEVISPGEIRRAKEEPKKEIPLRQRFIMRGANCNGCCAGFIVLLAIIYLLFR